MGTWLSGHYHCFLNSCLLRLCLLIILALRGVWLCILCLPIVCLLIVIVVYEVHRFCLNVILLCIVVYFGLLLLCIESLFINIVSVKANMWFALRGSLPAPGPPSWCGCRGGRWSRAPNSNVHKIYIYIYIYAYTYIERERERESLVFFSFKCLLCFMRIMTCNQWNRNPRPRLEPQITSSEECKID